MLDSGGKHVLVGPPANGGEDVAISGRVTMIGDCLRIGSSGDAPDGVSIPDTCKSETIVTWRPE